MFEFHPYFTNDGSVGLYSEGFDDIYHSSTGALTEAFEKFVQPIDHEWLYSHPELKVLDICFGIGYNSKTFLNFIFEKNFSKKSFLTKNTIAPIYTDKNIVNQPICNESIHTNNNNFKISITALDNDENLYFLSPFIKTGKNNLKNQNFNFKSEKIEKYLKNNKNKKNPKINKLINFLIFQKIAQNTPEIFDNQAIISLLLDKRYKCYFEADIVNLFKFELKRMGKYNHKSILKAFLHNIYYRYITLRYKKWLNVSNFPDIIFNYKNGDARISLKADTNSYNLVFLDAFIPSKCPCLWSYHFFKLLFEKLEDDGLILTYSTSSAVRAAMQEAGFYIGNILNPRLNKVTGTIATKNKSLIKYPLSEFDLGLLKTTAGIFYRDEDLTGLNEAIKALRDLDVKNSARMSTSKYKKIYKNKELICNMM